MSRPALPAGDLARTVVFAAFIAVLGLFPGLYVGGSGVPIVLQNAGPLLAGCVLGARRGTASVVLFLALTAIGLPLLSGGRGGIAPFIGPSGGFLIGWIFSALVVGLIVARLKRPNVPVLLLAAAAGVVADYVFGITYLGIYTGDLGAAAVQSLVFLPGDAAKVVAVALIGAVVHRALPGKLVGSASRSE
ncbi:MULTISPECIES: biotin transporter BioY [Amycolatopsis]|uniref:Biotin transporter n=1 Tax=Amycolatopsis thermoflava TaxID=84480 RepID=A0A3N2GMZ4_9PSEU|nr:biotin transporter BioY [Amycolatopsis thermoflava]ROS38006.1 biotin transport system substrate-specific component [Amycolatopsis thermoflava]